MSRLVAGLAAGLGLTAAASAAAWLAGASAVALGVAIGGLAGTLLAGASSGAQVALVRARPASGVSFAAMVAGFFAKVLALVAGILLLQGPDAPAHPVAFGVSLAGASLLVSGVVLPGVLRESG